MPNTAETDGDQGDERQDEAEAERHPWPSCPTA